MENGFSGIVRISNVSDFIAPSQACIIPLRKDESRKEEPLVGIRGKSTAKQNDETSKKVTVSLNDCLACNGCITSAETILIQEQSTPKLLEGLSKCSVGVVTVCPQSVCSLATKRGMTVPQTARLLSRLFKGLGVKYVLDSSFGRYLTLRLSYDEFVQRRQHAPLLASSCPGFVCYAEKTHGELLVAHISRVRSPQAMMGSLVKDYLARVTGTEPSEVFHATVMPCFDKKLEASRPDFATPTRQVDCVLSTVEVDALLDEREAGCAEEGEGVGGDASWLQAFGKGVLIGAAGGSSGGYAQYIVDRFIQHHPHSDTLTTRTTQRMKNLVVIEVVDDDSKVLLRVGKCYGFRNIQNIVQKLKRGKAGELDYIEVMACPDGCANGGGQIRAQKADERRNLLDYVNVMYEAMMPEEQLERQMEQVTEEWSRLNEGYRDLCYTDYHVVDKSIVDKMNLRW